MNCVVGVSTHQALGFPDARAALERSRGGAADAAAFGAGASDVEAGGARLPSEAA